MRAPIRLPLPAVARRHPSAYLPLFGWLALSALTVYCYAGGPFIFSHDTSPTLYAYLFSVHLAICLGYTLAVTRYRHPAAPPVSAAQFRTVAPWLVLPAVVGTYTAVVSNAATGMTIGSALQDPDSARKTWIDAGGSLTLHLTVLLSIANYPLLATAFCYWRFCSRIVRGGALAVVAGIVVYGVQGGARAAIFGVLCVAAACALASAYSGSAPWRPSHLAIVLPSAVLFFVLYSAFVASHRSARAIADYASYLRSQTESPIDRSHYALDGIPPAVAPALLSGYFYFGHGYEGLAMALDKPFIGSGFGIGHSAVLVRTAAKVIDSSDVFQRSHFYRLIEEDGLSPSLWVTIYPWIASDLTFPGSVAFMGIMAWWLATAWLDVLNRRSIPAAWVLAWLTFTVASTSSIFPPGDYGALISFWGSIVYWLRTRKHAVAAPV